MADLNKEQYEQLPDFIKGDYEQDGDVYKHAGFLTVKRTANDLDTRLKEATGKLTEYEQKQSERQAEAERKALEKLKSEGKVDEIIADAELRIGETKKQFEARIEKMTNQIKTEKRSALVSELSEMATPRGKAAFKKLIASRIDVDAETGKFTFLNEDGSASSLDLAGFKAELMKDDSLSPLLQADIVTNGGGNLNGNNDGGASVKTMKREQFEQLSDKNKMEFVKTGGKIN